MIAGILCRAGSFEDMEDVCRSPSANHVLHITIVLSANLTHRQLCAVLDQALEGRFAAVVPRGGTVVRRCDRQGSESEHNLVLKWHSGKR